MKHTNAIVAPAGPGPGIYVQRTAQPKAVKNRANLDVNGGGGPAIVLNERRQWVNAAVARAPALGGNRLGAVEARGEYWALLQDPKGNLFCPQ